MGTRSLTRVYNEDGKEIICLYRQYDGYPEGHGLELAKFLNGFNMTDGIYGIPGSKNLPKKLANGMGCLAAQLVAHFKTEPGQFYLYPPGTKDVWEEYEYHVGTLCKTGPTITCIEVDGETLFTGQPAAFIEKFGEK